MNVHAAMAGQVDLNLERLTLPKLDWREYTQAVLGYIEDTGSNAVATSANPAVESTPRARTVSPFRHD